MMTAKEASKLSTIAQTETNLLLDRCMSNLESRIERATNGGWFEIQVSLRDALAGSDCREADLEDLAAKIGKKLISLGYGVATSQTCSFPYGCNFGISWGDEK